MIAAGSSARKASIEKIGGEFEKGDEREIKVEIDVRFPPANDSNKPPAAYKQFPLTAAAIYPPAIIVPPLLSPLFEIVPAFKNELLGNLLVAIMNYLIMPRLIFLVQRLA